MQATLFLLFGKDARLEGFEFLLTSTLGDVGEAGLHARAVRGHLMQERERERERE